MTLTHKPPGVYSPGTYKLLEQINNMETSGQFISQLPDKEAASPPNKCELANAELAETFRPYPALSEPSLLHPFIQTLILGLSVALRVESCVEMLVV